MKVGRNDLCPCGSGRKFKLCHLNTAPSVAPWRKRPAPDTLRKIVTVAKGAAQLNAKMHKLETFRQHFGAVLPPSHVNAFGKKLVGIGSDIYEVDERSSFFDVLRGHVQYELLVAAIFARAGFELFPEDVKTSPPKPPEFTAVDRETKFAVAVEAKSRNRRQSDTNPERVQMDALIADAAKKSHGSKPFVAFLDVAMPPLPGDAEMPRLPRGSMRSTRVLRPCRTRTAALRSTGL